MDAYAYYFTDPVWIGLQLVTTVGGGNNFIRINDGGSWDGWYIKNFGDGLRKNPYVIKATVDRNKAIIIPANLMSSLGLSLTFEGRGGSNLDTLIIEVEDPSVHGGWRVLGKYNFNDPDFRDLQKESVNIPVEFFGARNLRFSLTLFDDTNPTVDIIGVTTIPLPATLPLAE